MTGVEMALVATVAVLTAVCAWLARRNRVLKEENRRLSVDKTDGCSWDGEDGTVGKTDGCSWGDEEGAVDKTDGCSADDVERTDEDDELFASIDRRIDEGRLYLDPGFGRDSICRLTGLSKERVGQLIKRYGGVGNLQVYVNRKRAAYAKQLMREHKNYTMEAIANECGIGNLSTFYRIFKQVYGVSPAEFRRSVAGGAEVE